MYTSETRRRAQHRSDQQQQQPKPTRLSPMAAGSRLYFTQNLLQRDENAQKKTIDTINPPKNIIFWKISVIFWGIVKAGHKNYALLLLLPQILLRGITGRLFPS
jgi:hypothetical protein